MVTNEIQILTNKNYLLTTQIQKMTKQIQTLNKEIIWLSKEDFVEHYLQLYLYLKAYSFIKIQRSSHVNFARKILMNNTYNYSYIQMQMHS